jgi:FkbM family methyltransferase
MSIRGLVNTAAMQLTRSEKGQAFLEKIAGRLERWQGYGSGGNLETSGEQVLFEVVRKMDTASVEKTIFDVGANIGDFTAAARHALGREINIHAFEPASDVFARLADRFANDERITVNDFALGRVREERPLYGPNNVSVLASLLDRNLDHVEMKSSFQEVVKVLPLSDYCLARGIEQIHLLKLDVEGFELEVLRGGEPLFHKRMIRACSFEFGGCNLDARTFLRDYFEFFTDHGMNLFRITPAATLVRLPHYRENFERFMTTNYLAVDSDTTITV